MPTFKDLGLENRTRRRFLTGASLREALAMQSDQFNLDRLNKVSIEATRSYHVYNRASGLSASLQNQQSMKSESVAKSASFYHSNPSLEGGLRHTSTDADHSLEETCCVCGETFSWEDQKVFTKCCDIAIGSHCRAQQIADTGACWNCGEEDVQSEEISETGACWNFGEEEVQNEVNPEPGSWVSYDPKIFATRYAIRIPANDARSQLAIRKAQAGGILRNVPSIEDSSALNGSDTGGSEPPCQLTQPLFRGFSKEQCEPELGMYRSRIVEQSSGDVESAPQSSTQLMDACTKNYGPTDGGFPTANTTPPESQNHSFHGSESAGPELSRNNQQHVHALIPKVQKQKEARQYVIEATKHLVEMCEAYGDEIDEADKDDVVGKILEAVEGCKTLQAAIEKRILENGSTLATQPASVPSPAATEISKFKPGEGNTYCRRCEELESRLKKAADALMAL